MNINWREVINGGCVSVVIKEEYSSTPVAQPGELCGFPFVYGSKWYYSCRRMNTRPFCKTAAEDKGFCVDKGTTPAGTIYFIVLVRAQCWCSLPVLWLERKSH